MTKRMRVTAALLNCETNVSVSTCTAFVTSVTIFGLKRGEVTGEWKKLHNEELSDLYCSPNIVWVIK
jgi:hypothetical protein